MTRKEKLIVITYSLILAVFVSIFAPNFGIIAIPTFFWLSILLLQMSDKKDAKEISNTLHNLLWAVGPTMLYYLIFKIAL